MMTALTLAKAVWSRPYLLIPLVVAATWFVKGVLEEFECANEARVAALQAELKNQQTINANNKALREAAEKDVAGLRIEVEKRKQHANALIEQFKAAGDGCQFTDEELERLKGAGQ